ncbi:MAG: methionyl-tRNA formyltransferase, partial [Duncaniella sp.]|nr:methionyl-tRNA formyltransferase [Duncaniella sp.]
MKPEKNLKIVFLGTPEFAVESLDAIVKAGYDVAAVVTMPDKPAGRGKKLFQSPVKVYATEKGIPVLQPDRLKDPDFIDRLRAIGADLFVVIAFRMLPEVVWSMPPMGTFNLHASLLPRYRGAAPINRAVMNGDTVTGVTTFLLKHEIDTGDILAQEQIEILPEDNVGTVHDKLMHLGARLTLDTISALAGGTATPVPQENLIGDTEPTPAPKIFKEDCHIDWNSPAETIHNLIRGLSPYPGAWTTLFEGDTPQGDIKIFESSLTDNCPASLSPGQIHIADGHLWIGTASQPLEILSLQAPGKRRLPT